MKDWRLFAAIGLLFFAGLGIAWLLYQGRSSMPPDHAQRAVPPARSTPERPSTASLIPASIVPTDEIVPPAPGTGAVAAGLVLLAPSYEPATGVRVALERADSEGNAATARSNADGAFTFHNLIDGEYILRANDPRFVTPGTPPRFWIANGDDVDDLALTVTTGAVIAGRVYHARTGAPLPGMAVRAQGADGRTAHSDAAGKYRIEGLRGGGYILDRERHEEWLHGSSPGARHVHVGLGGLAEGIDLHLDLGLALRGRVVDAAGEPLAGVAVTSHVLGSAWEQTETGADGRFEHHGFAQGANVELSVKHESHAAPRQGPHTFADTDLEGIEIVLQPAASVAGVVVDQRGRPLNTFQVEAHAPGRTETTSTEENGTFRLTGLLPDIYTLLARPYGHDTPTPLGTPLTVSPRAGQAVDGIRLVYDAVAQDIAGHVLDSDGHPVAGARVFCPSHLGGSITKEGSFLTLEDGAFDFLVFDDGRYRVFATHPDFESGSVEALAGDQGISIVLDRLASVFGRVLSTHNEPLDYFELKVLHGDHMENFEEDHSPFTSFMDPEGRFYLDQVYHGTVTLVARAPGHAPKAAVFRDLPAQQPAEEVLLQLAPGAAIEGHVHDAQGHAVPGAAVSVNSWRPQGSTNPHEGIAAISDSEGNFFIDSLGSPQVALHVQHPDYQRATTKLRLNPGAVTPVRVTLRGGGTIEGLVRVDREPASNIWVWAAPLEGDGDRVSRRTGPDGRYMLSAVPLGEVRVTATATVNGVSLSSEQTAVVSSTGVARVDFDFHFGVAVLEGYVTHGGTPVTQGGLVHASLDGAGQQVYRGQIDEYGTYRLEGLPEGRLVLRVRAYADRQRPEREVTVNTHAGQVTRFDVDLSTGSSVQVTVSGMPAGVRGGVLLLRGLFELPQTGIDFNALNQHIVASEDLAGDGVATLASIEAGDYTLIAGYTYSDSPEDLRIVSQHITFDGTQHLDVAIALR